MYEVQFHSREIAEMERLLARAPAIAREELRRAVEESTKDVKREVVKRTPTNKVTTGGRLRNAISSRVEEAYGGFLGIVEVHNVPYALWVEEDTKPHIISAKNARALAFSPVAGFQKVFREAATGRRLSRKAAAGATGVVEERGRALYRVQYHRASELPKSAILTGKPLSADPNAYMFIRTGKRGVWTAARRAPKDGRIPEKLITTPGASTMIFRQWVRHPGTKGQHMFRDGAEAAFPKVARLFGAAVRRVTRRLRV